MKFSFSYFFLLIFLVSCSQDDPGTNQPGNSRVFDYLSGTKIKFATQEEAQKLLSTSDEYTQNLTRFDIQSKTQNTGASSESDYLQHAADQARDWVDVEIAQMTFFIEASIPFFQNRSINLNLPDEIILVKSSMQEEGGANGYTRANVMVLRGASTQALFLHELFHIYSRYNPEKRDELYATINFEPSNLIQYPSAIADRIISNPDAITLEHYLTTQIDSQDQDVVFIIHSEEDYNGGSFFDYLKQSLMVVEGSAQNKTVKLENDLPILRNFNDSPNLKDLIGRNTNYTLHPEEIIAEHFQLMLQGIPVPEPQYLDALEEALK